MNFHSSLSLRGTITNTPLLIMMTSSNGKSFALLAICAGNSPVSGEFPAQRPVTGGFDVFFDLRPDKQLSKQWWGWWFETPSHLLWRHRNDGLVYWRMTITRSRWYWIYVSCAFGAVISLVHSYMILYGLQLRTCVAEAGITSKSTGKTLYPTVSVVCIYLCPDLLLVHKPLINRCYWTGLMIMVYCLHWAYPIQ